MCGGLFGGGAPTQPSVDPAAERRKAEAEATSKTNAKLLATSRRKRKQRGLLASEDGASSSVLAKSVPKESASVLGRFA